MRTLPPIGAGRMCRRTLVLALCMLCATACSAKPATFDPRDPRSPLRLVRTIPLPDVRGRIDHMAIDPRANRLFVAEIGNGSVDEVDLTAGKVSHRISGLSEPQGLAWLPGTAELAVACGDGSVRFFRGPDWHEVARISLGDDADNVRIDPSNGHLVVGYGTGGLAVIDPSTHQLLKRIPLSGHPEAFAILGARIFVNVPSRHRIAVVDLDRGRVISSLPVGARAGNYPMALNGAGSAIAVAFRFPASAAVIGVGTGRLLFATESCADADDLYFAKGGLAIVCGQGAIDLVSLATPDPPERVTTREGARTGLLASDGKTLFIAVPKGASAAELWELTFNPRQP